MYSVEKFQIAIGIIVSLATMFIGWKTFQLNELTQQNNRQLEQINRELSQTKFDFDRLREIYDRTANYLAAEKQNEKRGKALAVLIKSLPSSSLREDLLGLVIEDSHSVVVAAAAANIKTALRADVPVPHEPVRPNGSFVGKLVFKLNDDGYTVTLLEPFSFTDSKGIKWEAPKGFVSDGASIPRALWSIIGAPLSGNLTSAAILHDYYASERTRSVDDTNRMFYEAMLQSGVSTTTATLVYTSVAQFGPRWVIRAAPN